MLFPVRCWTCGKVIGHLWEEFSQEANKLKATNESLELGPLFDKLGVKRFCCYTIFLSHYETFEQSIKMGFPEDYESLL